MFLERKWIDGVKCLAVAGLLIGALAACDGQLLDVEDPDNVQPTEDLEPANASAQFAGMVNDFRTMYDFYARYAGLLTDEFILAGTFPTRREIDQRNPISNNTSINQDMWTPVSVSRATADNLANQFSTVLANPDFANVTGTLEQGIAWGRLLGGYDRVFLAELFCQSILGGQDDFPSVVDEEPESAPLGSDARMQQALTILEQAETRASDFGLTDVENAAKVGQARAHMWLGNYTEAADIASEVSDEFVFMIDYSDATPGEENGVFQSTWGVNASLRWTVGDGSDPSRGNEEFAFYDEWVEQGLVLPSSISEAEPPGGPQLAAFNGVSPVAAQTLYAGRSGTVAGAPMVLASGWEARMIEAEVELRTGSPAAAESDVNDILEDPAQTINPMLSVEPSLANPGGPGDFTPKSVGAFSEVDFSGTLQENLVEMGKAYEAGLWMTGHRQHFLRRIAEEFGDRTALGMYPIHPPPDGGDAISLPVPSAEVDNNENISNACPAGLP